MYANGACAQLSTHGAVPTSDDWCELHAPVDTVWTLNLPPQRMVVYMKMKEYISSRAPPHPESDHCRLKEMLHHHHNSNAILVKQRVLERHRQHPANLAGNLRHRHLVCACGRTRPRAGRRPAPGQLESPSRQSWWHTHSRRLAAHDAHYCGRVFLLVQAAQLLHPQNIHRIPVSCLLSTNTPPPLSLSLSLSLS